MEERRYFCYHGRRLVVRRLVVRRRIQMDGTGTPLTVGALRELALRLTAADRGYGLTIVSIDIARRDQDVALWLQGYAPC